MFEFGSSYQIEINCMIVLSLLESMRHFLLNSDIEFLFLCFIRLNCHKFIIESSFFVEAFLSAFNILI